MRFAVLTEADPKELPIAEYLETVERGHEYLQREISRGRVRDVFVRAGMAAGLWIVEADSREEVEQLLQGSPTAPYARYQTIPLTEPEDPAMNSVTALQVEHNGGRIHFADELEIAATAPAIYALLWNVERWPKILPHVKRISIHSQRENEQDFEMETVGPAGTHVNRSIRRGTPHRAISYEQIQPPQLFRVHRGVWTIEGAGAGVVVKSAHIIELDPAQIKAVLGRAYALAEAAVLVRHFVGNHSVATLNIVKQLAESSSGANHE